VEVNVTFSRKGRTKARLTVEVWQPRAARDLQDEEAREIAENIVGFFNLLLEWESAERERRISGADDTY
jgi:hypothetical protein